MSRVDTGVVDPVRAIAELQELIAALDRRVPQMHRIGEAAIAQSSAALRAQAMARIQELERERR